MDHWLIPDGDQPIQSEGQELQRPCRKDPPQPSPFGRLGEFIGDGKRQGETGEGSRVAIHIVKTSFLTG